MDCLANTSKRRAFNFHDYYHRFRAQYCGHMYGNYITLSKGLVTIMSWSLMLQHSTTILCRFLQVRQKTAHQYSHVHSRTPENSLSQVSNLWRALQPTLCDCCASTIRNSFIYVLPWPFPWSVLYVSLLRPLLASKCMLPHLVCWRLLSPNRMNEPRHFDLLLPRSLLLTFT